MSNEINYRSKYEQLKAQFMASVDTAFRLGYEQGAQEAQMENIQAQQQQADAEAAAQQPGQPDQPGQPGEEAQAPEEQQAPDSVNPEGSELDQHIAKLESMLGKSEITGEELKKAFSEVKSFKEKLAIRKNDKAIKSIAKSLKKPAFNIGKKAAYNLNDISKGALNMQEKIVSDVMHKWEEQEKDASKNIMDILNVENLIKK